MAAPPTVSAMFLTRGRPQLVERALSAVLEDPATTEAIVVVDDDPVTKQRLQAIAESEPRLRVTDTPPPDERGLDRTQRGRDHGAELATSEVVLALDDDVVAEAGLVSGHARAHAENDGPVVVVGYMPVATRRSWPWSYAPVQVYAESYEDHCRRYEEDPGEILRNLWGGNVSIRRSHWLEALRKGRVPCYHEDQEFGLLLAREGFRGHFDRSLRGDHWYERNLRGFVLRAEKTVGAHAELRAAYPELMEHEEQLPERPSLKVLLRIARVPGGWFAVKWGLIAATTLAGALRFTRLERMGADALWMIASARAAEERTHPSAGAGVQ
jgi:hypothetical protein